MSVLVSCLAALSTLAVLEQSLNRLPFAVASFAVLTGTILQATGDAERAILLAALLAIAIGGFSAIKHHHSGLKLRVADLALVFAGTLRFLLMQYKGAAGVAVGGALVLMLLASGVMLFADGEPLTLGVRLGFLAAAIAVTGGCWLSEGGGTELRRIERHPDSYFSTFAASLIDVRSWWPARGLSFDDIAPDQSLPLSAAISARRAIKPDILVIQHESVFDPRLYGLPVGPEIAEFLSPTDAISGTLNVDIYGGGSWQSEFSLLTGLSSASFGPDAYFIFRKGAGHFRHTLPHVLRELGYRTTLVSSCRRDFLNYEHFYRTAGIDETLFADDSELPLDLAEFERTYSDRLFFEALGKVMTGRSSSALGPRFHYALTNFNHGPHDRLCVELHEFAAERSFALRHCNEPPFAEFYVRLAETARNWRQLKSRLATANRNRPLLIVHYGDHQPVMTRRLERALSLAPDPARPFRTFFAIEALNFELDRATIPAPPILDIAFLGTVALGAAGLPLDRIAATRASLIATCGASYFETESDEKRRLHRTLVELGLIDLGKGRSSTPRLTTAGTQTSPVSKRI